MPHSSNPEMTIPSSAFRDTKSHLLLLDTLRGIAAMMVVLTHIFLNYCYGDYSKMLINHGYLTAEFFFMLAGYVMAHAYDDRWDRMTVGNFFKRRLIRLHPMVIMAMALGAAFFFLQSSSFFPKVADSSVWQVLLLMIIGFMLIPVPPSMDIRGWFDMYPLNTPVWTLFHDYVANIIHALFLRNLSKAMLSVLVILAGAILAHHAITGASGDMNAGPSDLRIGFIRLLFPYMAGMLLRRVVPVKGEGDNMFLACGLLIAVLVCPRIGGSDAVWKNGIYESVVIILVFPLIIYLGATGVVKGKWATRGSIFLNDISYPLYITHFPIQCVYIAWVDNNDIPFGTGVWVGLLVVALNILVAYAVLKVYDEPVRRWLTKRFM